MTFIDTYITKLAGVFFARSKVLLATAGILLLSLLVACAPPVDDGGGSADTYTIGGTVAGHTGEVSLKLTYGDETETLKIETGTDKFTFAAKLEDKQSFTIDVTAPQGQTCSSSVTQGTIVSANITNVNVTCSDAVATPRSISGIVSGLAENETVTLTLSPTGGTAENINVTGDAATTDESFVFETKIIAGATYTITITTGLPGKTCTVTPAGEQTMGEADVTNITVTCGVTTYSVGGAVSGLAENETITLTLTPTDGTAEDKTVTGDAATTDDDFVFGTKLVAGATYTVTIATEPTNRICTIDDADTRTIVDDNVTDIVVTCIATYSIGGKVNEAADNSQIFVTLSHGDAGNPPANIVTTNLVPSTDGTFIFDNIPANRVYLLSVTSATANEVCTPDVTTYSAPITADVTDAVITCSIAAIDTYSMSGRVSGLADGDIVTVTLTTTGGVSENKVITGNNDETTDDGLAFNTRLASGDSYTIAVTTSPTGKTCTVSPTGTQTVVDVDVTNIVVTCVVNSYSVRGAVSGLANGETVTLTLTPTGGNEEPGNVAGDNDESTDDDFAFNTPVAYGATYTVTITTEPTDKTCTLAPEGTQTMGAADANIAVTCVTKTYSIGGAVSGLANGEAVTLTLTPTDGDAENENVTGGATAGDSFTFDTKLASGASYAVTVTTPPTGKTCEVVPAGTQTVVAADVADIAVTCVVNSYSVRGAVSGLASGEVVGLTLTPTGGTAENEDVTGDGNEAADDPFAFDTLIAYGDTYEVAVTTSPADKICTVTPAGTQTVADADANISVTCVVNIFSVTVVISGLASAEVIGLALSRTGPIPETKYVTGDADETTDDPITFDTLIVYGDTYEVNVISAPSGKLCTVTPAGTQTMGDADANISVTCVAEPTYSVSGTVTGHTGRVGLTLGALGYFAEARVEVGDTTFAFSTEMRKGTIFSISITSPQGQKCTTAPAGDITVEDTDITNIVVTCVEIQTYSIGGRVSGHTSGFVLLIKYTYDGESYAETDWDIAAGDTTFTYSQKFEKDTKYTITLKDPPAGQSCTITPAGEQIIGDTDVTDIMITCQ